MSVNVNELYKELSCTYIYVTQNRMAQLGMKFNSLDNSEQEMREKQTLL